MNKFLAWAIAIVAFLYVCVVPMLFVFLCTNFTDGILIGLSFAYAVSQKKIVDKMKNKALEFHKKERIK